MLFITSLSTFFEKCQNPKTIIKQGIPNEFLHRMDMPFLIVKDCNIPFYPYYPKYDASQQRLEASHLVKSALAPWVQKKMLCLHFICARLPADLNYKKFQTHKSRSFCTLQQQHTSKAIHMNNSKDAQLCIKEEKPSLWNQPICMMVDQKLWKKYLHVEHANASTNQVPI